MGRGGRLGCHFVGAGQQPRRQVLAGGRNGSIAQTLKVLPFPAHGRSTLLAGLKVAAAALMPAAARIAGTASAAELVLLGASY